MIIWGTTNEPYFNIYSKLQLTESCTCCRQAWKNAKRAKKVITEHNLKVRSCGNSPLHLTDHRHIYLRKTSRFLLSKRYPSIVTHFLQQSVLHETLPKLIWNMISSGIQCSIGAWWRPPIGHDAYCIKHFLGGNKSHFVNAWCAGWGPDCWWTHGAEGRQWWGGLLSPGEDLRRSCTHGRGATIR